MNQSYFNEIINGHLVVFSLWAVVLFLRFWWNNIERGYWFLRPVAAVMSMAMADVVIRIPFWVNRHYVNAGSGGLLSSPWFYVTVSIGVIFKCWAVLCIIRVFAPDAEIAKGPFRYLILWSVISSIVIVEGWLVIGLYYGY